jgi:alkanesulfonate monooxygenase SsuD/methylene tetrahydromethanopterin reductase-like flavin-dependent oxidoreductase (luciferase family)
MMHLGYSLTPFGHHPDAWQQVRNPEKLGFDALLAQIVAAETAGFDFILLADRLGLRPKDELSSVATPFEPTLLASALAAATHRIGIIAAASTIQHEPYNLARRFASLDLIGEGRTGWLALTGSPDEERDAEYLDVVSGLWESYETDAFLYDKKAGRFFDPKKMHVLDHMGRYFAVRGPLNVNPSPQGKPVVAALVGGEGDGLAAQRGEVLLLRAKTSEDIAGIARDTTQAVAASGRRRQDVRLLANVVPVVAETSAAAAEMSRALQFSEADRKAQPLAGTRIVGTPAEFAERLQDIVATNGLDGVTILPPTLGVAERFIADVVPELRRRGLAGSGKGGTLRDRLGLPAVVLGDERKEMLS